MNGLECGCSCLSERIKDDKESKEFYYLGRIRHEAGGVLKQFVMPNTDVSAVEIEYKLETPVEKNLYDYLTSENV